MGEWSRVSPPGTASRTLRTFAIPGVGDPSYTAGGEQSGLRCVGVGAMLTQPVREAAQRQTDVLASFTADVERDCPPYLTTRRGMEEGLPRFLDLLAARGVRGTLFVTGEMARQFPDIVNRIVREGHELGCHGDLHRDFSRLERAEAEAELTAALTTLREFAPVVSFRAPYLRFPPAYLDLLPPLGLRIDSSRARYKRGPYQRADVAVPGLTRIPASVTSSVLRLPALLRTPWLKAAGQPLVLFIHPWEAVDFRRSRLRWDCRFRTGTTALRLWNDAILQLQHAGAEFRTLQEIADGTDGGIAA
jgi:peptidoglycan/xylan/chitin deacetylase (PgdA/CDA1 family)